MKTTLTIAAILGVVGLSAQGQTIHFNIGESSNGQETIDGETWNLLGEGTYTTIYDSTGTTLLPDVVIHVEAIYTSKGGLGRDHVQGKNYITKELNPMTDSFLYSSADSPTGSSQIQVTISGLSANSEWDLDVFAGVNKNPRQQSITINGGAAVNYVTDNTPGGTYAQKARIHYNNVLADNAGKLTIDLNGIPTETTNVSFIQGITLKKISEPSRSEIPEPTSYALLGGLLALTYTVIRRGSLYE